jgi:hypothetical protein
MAVYIPRLNLLNPLCEQCYKRYRYDIYIHIMCAYAYMAVYVCLRPKCTNLFSQHTYTHTHMYAYTHVCLHPECTHLFSQLLILFHVESVVSVVAYQLLVLESGYDVGNLCICMHAGMYVCMHV